MDSLDLKNTLVLDKEALPGEVKELLSRLQPNDKVTIKDGTFHLVEDGEKVVTLAIQDGDSLTILADPSEDKSVSFKMGDSEELSANPEEDDEDDEDEDSEKSVSVESMKSGMYESPVPGQ